MLTDFALTVFLFGWAAIWPVARWGLRLTGKRYRTLARIFALAVVLDALAILYVRYLHEAGNPDWWMAWLFPQFIAAVAWLASIIAVLVLWSNRDAAT